MSNIITIGYSTEGTTDKRFLEAIIKKTFDEVAFECESMIEVYDPTYINFEKGTSFVDSFEKLSKNAFSNGISILCIHVDADCTDDINVFENKINPAFDNVYKIKDKACNNLVAIVPITMSESWMLADKELFKKEIYTDLSNQDLGIHKQPEAISDPKETIINALRVAQNGLPKRRNKILISDIYQPIGQNIALEHLEKLGSYIKFKQSIRNAFVKLNYLH